MGGSFMTLAENVSDYAALGTAMTEALTQIQIEILSLVAVIAPIGIVIFGSVLCVQYAKKFFKKLSA